jgi:glyoxylase-like metal-dependent hydrolase (beta-lactamase superfamily II)
VKTALLMLAIVSLSSAQDIEVLPVQGNVYMLAGAGGNITLQVGKSGVLMVDTASAPMSGKVLAAIRKLSEKPLRYIVNTAVDADHTGGNESLAKVFGSATEVSVVNTPGGSATQTVAILAHQKVLDRMSAPDGVRASWPTTAWPTDTFLGEEKELYFNGEGIQILHEPAAHTDGDSIVYFRRSDVISAGDIFVTTGYPVIDLAKGGSLQGVIAGLNRILDLAIPAHHEEGGTYVIPGHGRICDEFDVLEYRDMITIIRDRIQAMVKKGMTLEQVKAARPSRDYDPQYGATSGAWTTDMFVEAAYKSLAKK